MAQSISQCITTCSDCHRICLETLAHCLAKGGKHVEAKHIQLLMDCAEICGTCVNFMARGSAHHAHICKECAEICKACEESCASIGDAECNKCAEACRKCAAECGSMATSMA